MLLQNGKPQRCPVTWEGVYKVLSIIVQAAIAVALIYIAVLLAPQVDKVPSKERMFQIGESVGNITKAMGLRSDEMAEHSTKLLAAVSNRAGPLMDKVPTKDRITQLADSLGNITQSVGLKSAAMVDDVEVLLKSLSTRTGPFIDALQPFIFRLEKTNLTALVDVVIDMLHLLNDAAEGTLEHGQLQITSSMPLWRKRSHASETATL